MATTQRQPVHESLGEHQSGCVVWIVLNDDLTFRCFRWFGDKPGRVVAVPHGLQAGDESRTQCQGHQAAKEAGLERAEVEVWSCTRHGESRREAVWRCSRRVGVARHRSLAPRQGSRVNRRGPKCRRPRVGLGAGGMRCSLRPGDDSVDHRSVHVAPTGHGRLARERQARSATPWCATARRRAGPRSVACRLRWTRSSTCARPERPGRRPSRCRSMSLTHASVCLPLPFDTESIRHS